MSPNKFRISKIRLGLAKTKSQAAMEFLMTYGWAILVVVIVLAALVYFGLMDPERLLSDKAEISPELHITDSAVDEDSMIFMFTNNKGKPIYDLRLNVTACDDGKGALTNPETFAAGQTKKLTVYCGETSEPGTKFKSPIQATYKTKDGDEVLDHSSDGELSLTVTMGNQSYASKFLTRYIDNCTELNENYTKYILSDDIIQDLQANCIVIANNNIILDLNNKKISYDGLANNYAGIYVDSYHDINITDGVVELFGYGISITSSELMYIDDMNLSSNWDAGIYLMDTSRITLEDNVICNNINNDVICASINLDDAAENNRFEDVKVGGCGAWLTSSVHTSCSAGPVYYLLSPCAE